ncbi:MAG: hypothetical protein D8M26_13565 [Ignavibacteriae bacterium]|nr:hypothetical protein [Ignavibacteriota bacterium]MCE7855103.1 hypothetical protein [Ignavibacteria bacterium CHB3]GJQ44132.1 MAG: hypothetical protein JETCAE03_36300 [Ignavibacteriaceae bacterium]
MIDLKKINVTFRISSIKTVRFNIDNSEEVRNIDRKSFFFNISLGTYINPGDKKIGFDVIQFVSLDKEMSNKVSELISHIEFEIVNFDEVVQKSDKLNEIKIPDQIMLTLISISLSTARGIFAAKVEGSALEGVYMPVIDPSTFKKIPLPSKETAEVK